MAAETTSFRSGFVSILGRPNVGKSTLLNAIVGTKLAIVAEKPQTTRTNVQGVWSGDHAQAVFLDTPGIHRADTLFNKRIMADVAAALEQRDLLLYVTDATQRFGGEDAEPMDLVRQSRTPAFLVLNKIDRVKDKARLLPLIEEYAKQFEFAEHVPVSALTGQGLDDLRSTIVRHLPEGPAYFPPDYLTDQPERFLAAELIREKAIRMTRDEVPHSIAVTVDKWEEKPRLTRIHATIYVDRAGQKAIIIGTKGAMLKKVGTAAREEMEALFGRKIFLELYVKVQPHWRDNPAFLKELDWRTMFGNGSNE